MKRPLANPLSSLPQQADNIGMARWIFLAALSVALLATPAWAQRSGGGGHGGMGGGGAHGGMSMGGSRGGYSGGGGYAAHGAYSGGAGYAYHGGGGYARVPSYAGAPRANWSGAYHGWNGSGWHGNGWNGWHGNGGYHYRGWGWAWPWWGWGYGYAGWGGYPWGGWYGGLGWDDSSYYAGNSYPYDTSSGQSYPSYVYVTPNTSSDNSQTYQAQQDEIDRLNNAVQRLQAQGPAPSPESRPQGKMTEIHANTVLIYRDGHAEEVENYAIVGKTIWVFNESRAKKIPLSELDLSATKRDNEDRGIEFVVPNSSH